MDGEGASKAVVMSQSSAQRCVLHFRHAGMSAAKAGTQCSTATAMPHCNKASCALRWSCSAAASLELGNLAHLWALLCTSLLTLQMHYTCACTCACAKLASTPHPYVHGLHAERSRLGGCGGFWLCLLHSHKHYRLDRLYLWRHRCQLRRVRLKCCCLVQLSQHSLYSLLWQRLSCGACMLTCCCRGCRESATCNTRLLVDDWLFYQAVNSRQRPAHTMQIQHSGQKRENGPDGVCDCVSVDMGGDAAAELQCRVAGAASMPARSAACATLACVLTAMSACATMMQGAHVCTLAPVAAVPMHRSSRPANDERMNAQAQRVDRHAAQLYVSAPDSSHDSCSTVCLAPSGTRQAPRFKFFYSPSSPSKSSCARHVHTPVRFFARSSAVITFSFFALVWFGLPVAVIACAPLCWLHQDHALCAAHSRWLQRRPCSAATFTSRDDRPEVLCSARDRSRALGDRRASRLHVLRVCNQHPRVRHADPRRRRRHIGADRHQPLRGIDAHPHRCHLLHRRGRPQSHLHGVVHPHCHPVHRAVRLSPLASQLCLRALAVLGSMRWVARLCGLCWVLS